MSGESPKRIRKAAPRWTKEDVEKLKHLYSAERLSMKEISAIMGRSVVAVSIKANRTIPESNPSATVDPQIISKVIDGYHRNDTLAKIQADTNVGQKTIRLILSRAGLKKRKHYDVAPAFSKELVEAVRKLYVDEKMSQTQVANKLGVERKIVRSIVMGRGFQVKPEWWSEADCQMLLEMLKGGKSLWDICGFLNKTDLQVISCSKMLSVFDDYPVLHKRLSGEQQEMHYFINVKLFAIKNFDRKKFGVDHTLTVGDVFNIYKRQGGKCFYTGEELQVRASCENSLSIERIDSQRPHCLDNIVLCTWESNQMKQDMSVEKFLSVSEKIAARTEEIRASLRELSHPSQAG